MSYIILCVSYIACQLPCHASFHLSHHTIVLSSDQQFKYGNMYYKFPVKRKCFFSAAANGDLKYVKETVMKMKKRSKIKK